MKRVSFDYFKILKFKKYIRKSFDIHFGEGRKRIIKNRKSNEQKCFESFGCERRLTAISSNSIDRNACALFATATAVIVRRY